jgi:hypothetical protein
MVAIEVTPGRQFMSPRRTEVGELMPRIASILVVVALLAPASSFAQDPAPGTDGEVKDPPRTYFNLRMGAATTSSSGRPEICVEGAPTDYISIEACGTGSGILHDDPSPEVAHFRVPITPFRLALGDSALAFRISPGFAELQVGRDTPGFDFSGTGEANVETAGPELSTSLQWSVPLAYDVEFLMNLDVGLAWFPYAEELSAPMPVWQPFLGLNAGIGF